MRRPATLVVVDARGGQASAREARGDFGSLCGPNSPSARARGDLALVLGVESPRTANPADLAANLFPPSMRL
jgi:hypothetical protein